MAPPVTIAIEYHRATLGHGTQLSYALTEQPDGSFVAKTGERVSKDDVDALKQAAAIDLQAGAFRGRCISHTDDYPVFDVTIGDLALHADSNCGRWTPWSVTVGKDKYAQYSGRLVPPLLAVLNAVDPKHWDDTRAPGWAGLPMIVLDAPSGGEPMAGECSRALAESTAVVGAFGEAAKIVRVQFDDTARQWRATIASNRFFTTVPVACGGGGDPASAVVLDRVVAFMHSQPGLAFVAAEGDGQLDATGAVFRITGERLAGAPTLEWVPGAAKIHVRTSGIVKGSADALWKALQIDPKPKRVGAQYVVEADVPL